jgi:hypothetical protein
MPTLSLNTMLDKGTHYILADKKLIITRGDKTSIYISSNCSSINNYSN